MENNNGKGIFYGVIGVATLIVAIIGATFAYFTATTASGQYVTGTAATASLGVTVTRMTGFSSGETGATADNADYIMVPQLDATLASALVGTDGNECIDANGSLVCSIYKIVVSNGGSSAIDISGRIDFYTGALDTLTPNGEDNSELTDTTDSIMNHLKWARLTNPTNVSGTTIPTTLLDYSTDTSYAALRPVALAGTGYANTDATQYLYGRDVASAAKDLYGDEYNALLDTDGTWLATVDTNGDGQLSEAELTSHWVTSHDVHYDLFDPTDDLDSNWATVTSAANNMGSIHLEASGTTTDANSDGLTDDKAALYIVVWISENLASQNEVDKGTLVGKV